MQESQERTFTSLELIRLVRKGDRAAAEALFARHLPRLHRWARTRISRSARHHVDTSDVVQDAAFNVFQRLDTFEPRHKGALQAYLRRAVINRLHDEHRRIARTPDDTSLPVDITDDARLSPFDELASAETIANYKRALATLPQPDQQAVVARIEMGYSYQQIALMLNRPSADAARMAVTRALVRIAQQITPGELGIP